MLTPGPDHPITLHPAGGRVVVTAGDVPVADTDGAVVLQESNYPAVPYIPVADVDPARLRVSEHTTHCPYKGDASYYDLVLPDGQVHRNAVWTYRDPYPAVAAIAGLVAFYPDLVDMDMPGRP